MRDYERQKKHRQRNRNSRDLTGDYGSPTSEMFHLSFCLNLPSLTAGWLGPGDISDRLTVRHD